VLGLSDRDDSRRIRGTNLMSMLDYENSARVNAGNVIRSDPGAGTEIERGSRVTLFVSSGPKEVVVPDVTGSSQDDAFARLEKLGLYVRSRQRASSEPTDTVVEQTPAGGQRLNEGSTITR